METRLKTTDFIIKNHTCTVYAIIIPDYFNLKKKIFIGELTYVFRFYFYFLFILFCFVFFFVELLIKYY